MSEGYTSKQAAQNGIESVRTNGPMEGRFAKLEASNGQFYFNLRAGNNQVIGTSELYTTAAARDNGIQSVMSNAVAAELIDNVLPNKPQPRFELFRDAPVSFWLLRFRFCVPWLLCFRFLRALAVALSLFAPNSAIDWPDVEVPPQGGQL